MRIDVTAILGSGVYLLWQGRECVYVGRATSMLTRVYTHRTLRRQQIRGRPTTVRTRLRPIIFDRVEVEPAALSDLDRLERELIKQYQPKYNILLKGPSIQVSIEELIGYCLKPKPKLEIGRRL